MPGEMNLDGAPGEEIADEACESCGQYTVHALVRVDERGQMVLPKEVRMKAGIVGGDKLALTTIEKDGEICCILLTKAGALVRVVQQTLGDAARAFVDET